MHTSFSKWLKQVLPSILAITVMLLPLSNSVQASTYSDNHDRPISTELVANQQSDETNQFTEYQLRYTPSWGFYDVSGFLESTNPGLNNCYFYVKDAEYPFPEAITQVSVESGIDPRVILTLLDVRLGIFDANASSVCNLVRSWSDELLALAIHMMDSTLFYSFGSNETQISDIARSQIDKATNAAKFAVIEASSRIAAQNGKSQKEVLEDFYNSYYGYFQKDEPLLMASGDVTALASPSFKMPFYGQHTFSGGPHNNYRNELYKCPLAVDGAATSGLDFAGSFPETNGAADESVLAIADGYVVGIRLGKEGENLSAPGQWVAIRHADGYFTPNDYVSLYFHLKSISKEITLNKFVNQGTVVGERGVTGCNGCSPHIHLELRRADGEDYSTYSGIGTPVSWNGKIIDGYIISSEYYQDSKVVNYYGTAINSNFVNSQTMKGISIADNSNGNCNNPVKAVVEPNFPYSNETNWNHTYFASTGNKSVIGSSNGMYCSSANGNPENLSLNGICDPPTSDKTLPTASFTSPQNNEEIKTTTLAIRANAADNAGGSGIKQVNFSAKWDGTWRNIGSDTSAPYETNYDLCTLKVPKGNIELGLEAIDNAGNKYVYSSNHSNPVVRYTAECTGGGGVPSGYWSKNIWTNPRMEGNAAVNTRYNGFFIEEDWGAGSPYSGIDSDLFSISYAQNINFQGGRYYFKIRSDDGARVLIDGVTRWNEWYIGHVDSGFDVDLQAGNHTVQVDFFENKGDAKIKVWFWGPGISRLDVDPPDGRITSFTNNSFIGQSPITITADAWDEESGILSVKFRVYHCQGGCGWRDISTDTSAPYSATWNHSGMEGQQVRFTLDVIDKSGKPKTFAGGEVAVTIDSTKPSVDISAPFADTSYFEKSFNIALSASDALAGIQRVKFQAGYPGDENYWHVLGEDTDGSNGWGLLWDGSSLPDGTHVDFYVEAVDNAGNTASDVVRAVRIGASVIFYEDAGFSGRSTSFYKKTASDLSLLLDNNASSIKIKPGWSIRVFEGNRIRRGWKCYQSDVSDLSYETYPNNSVGINDTISSVEVFPRATCPPLGDADWNGVIDGVDYATWHVNYTSTNTMGSSTADYNFDGIVDGIDYAIWHTAY